MATPKESPKRRRSRGTTPEALENHMIALAVDQAEKQLLDGTAPAQIVTHYLKLGTQREALELEKLRRETELLAARREEAKNQKDAAVLFEQAIEAMRSYSGNPD